MVTAELNDRGNELWIVFSQSTEMSQTLDPRESSMKKKLNPDDIVQSESLVIQNTSRFDVSIRLLAVISPFLPAF